MNPELLDELEFYTAVVNVLLAEKLRFAFRNYLEACFRDAEGGRQYANHSLRTALTYFEVNALRAGCIGVTHNAQAQAGVGLHHFSHYGQFSLVFYAYRCRVGGEVHFRDEGFGYLSRYRTLDFLALEVDQCASGGVGLLILRIYNAVAVAVQFTTLNRLRVHRAG